LPSDGEKSKTVLHGHLTEERKKFKNIFFPLKTLRTFEEMADYKAESAARLLQQNNIELLEAVVEGEMEDVKRSVCS